MWFRNRRNGSDCWPTAKEGHASMTTPTAAEPSKRLNTVHLRRVLSQSTSARDLSEPAADEATPRLEDARGPCAPSWSQGGGPVFPKLPQCIGLRFAIGSVRAGVPSDQNRQFCQHPKAARLFPNQAPGRPSGRAASRISSANSWPSGLSVLFFKITIASGLAVNGKSIGKALSSRRFGGKRITTRGTMDRKRPVISSAVRKGSVEPTITGGTLSPWA